MSGFYVGRGLAVRGSVVEPGTYYGVFDSRHEAEGWAMEQVQRVFPANDGYRHRVSMAEIPLSYLEAAVSAIRASQDGQAPPTTGGER